VPPLPTPIQELCDWVTHTLQAITVDMILRVWDEFDYCVDVCPVSLWKIYYWNLMQFHIKLSSLLVPDRLLLETNCNFRMSNSVIEQSKEYWGKKRFILIKQVFSYYVIELDYLIY
jgi:hypothetical protein